MRILNLIKKQTNKQTSIKTVFPARHDVPVSVFFLKFLFTFFFFNLRTLFFLIFHS